MLFDIWTYEDTTAKEYSVSVSGMTQTQMQLGQFADLLFRVRDNLSDTGVVFERTVSMSSNPITINEGKIRIIRLKTDYGLAGGLLAPGKYEVSFAYKPMGQGSGEWMVPTYLGQIVVTEPAIAGAIRGGSTFSLWNGGFGH